MDKSFVTDDFKEKESDIIYRIDFKGQPLYIFLLIEFQSTVDHFMPVRVLRYMMELYESLRIGGHNQKLPAIFPILLYNGDSKWNAANRIEDSIEQAIPMRYIPKFEYLPLLINEIPKNILLGIKNVVSAVFYVENSSVEEVDAEIDTVIELIKEEQPELVKLFVRWFNRAFQRKGKDVDELVDKIENITEVKNMLQTSLKQYEEKQFLKGMEQAALNMLSEKLPEDVIIRCTGLDHEYIEKLRDNNK